jgi:hypothetical protein
MEPAASKSVKVLRGTPLKTSEVWNGKHFSYSQRQLGQAYDTRGTIITYLEVAFPRPGPLISFSEMVDY